MRTTQRYGAILKQCLLDIQNVKSIQRGDQRQLDDQREVLINRIQQLLDGRKAFGTLEQTLTTLLNLLAKPEVPHMDKNRLANLDTLTRFMDQIADFKSNDMRRLIELESNAKPAPQSLSKKLLDEYYAAWINDKDTRNQHQLVLVIEREVTFLLEWIAKNAKSPSEQMLDEFALEGVERSHWHD